MTKTSVKKVLREIERSHNFEFYLSFQEVLDRLYETVGNECVELTYDYIADKAIQSGLINMISNIDSFLDESY